MNIISYHSLIRYGSLSILNGLLAFNILLATFTGCIGSSSDSTSAITGTWVRSFAYNESDAQRDEYHFYLDGTFDYHSQLTGNFAHNSNYSGRWLQHGNTITCSAKGYSDELLIVENGRGLMKLSSRARGIPPYRKQ
jgi:hypothetical protein